MACDAALGARDVLGDAAARIAAGCAEVLSDLRALSPGAAPGEECRHRKEDRWNPERDDHHTYADRCPPRHPSKWMAERSSALHFEPEELQGVPSGDDSRISLLHQVRTKELLLTFVEVKALPPT